MRQDLREKLLDVYWELEGSDARDDFARALIDDCVALRGALKDCLGDLNAAHEGDSYITPKPNEKYSEALSASDERLKSIGVEV
jgi:hypothetical protein